MLNLGLRRCFSPDNGFVALLAAALFFLAPFLGLMKPVAFYSGVNDEAMAIFWFFGVKVASLSKKQSPK